MIPVQVLQDNTCSKEINNEFEDDALYLTVKDINSSYDGVEKLTYQTSFIEQEGMKITDCVLAHKYFNYNEDFNGAGYSTNVAEEFGF